MIAQSVNASSEIEGEHVQAEHLPLVLTLTSSIGEEHLSPDEKRRLDATKSITEACLWALQRDERTAITFDFVMELHRRMFESTCPTIAGTLKTKDVFIRGAGYDIKTLPREKTETFLRALCERTSRTFELAHDHAEASTFLCVAEFLCDFLAIHPFADGNGRTSRILSTYLLERAGYHFAR
ncbi:MAG: Fic family protein, partial [Planctomycetota bacterium]